MSALDSTEYYQRRERQEREQAYAATIPYIAAIHLYMAERYVALARASSGTMSKYPGSSIFRWQHRRAAPPQAA